MCKACEPVFIKDFQKLGKKCATVANSADIISGADTVVCRDFVDAVCQNMSDLKLDKVSIVEFNALLATTVITELLTNGLKDKISPSVLSDFTDFWTAVLFSDDLGTDFTEKFASLTQIEEEGLESWLGLETVDDLEDLEWDELQDATDYLFNDGYLK